LEHRIIRRILLVLVIAFGIELSIYLARQDNGTGFSFEFEATSYQSDPGDSYYYKFTFGNQLKSLSTGMIQEVDESVEKFLKDARGKLRSEVDRRYGSTPIIAPIGVSEAKSYMVTVELTYKTAEEFYSDLNLAQKLGALGGRGIDNKPDDDEDPALVSGGDINDDRKKEISEALEKKNLETIQKRSEIFKDSLKLKIIDCDELMFGYDGSSEPTYSGGLSSTEKTSLMESDTKKIPPASRYKIPLSKLVIDSKVKIDPNLDITFPNLWPDVVTRITTKKTVCFRPA
jgi:hypothetical protein